LKDYLAEPKPVSPYKELIDDYQGPITKAAHWGESGGLVTFLNHS